MRRRLWLLVGAVAALVVGLGGGAAYAYFASSGSGGGTATSNTLQSVTIASAGTVSSPLLPGGPAANVTFTVANPNRYPLTLVSVHGSGSVKADAAHPDCTTTGVSFTDQSPDITIPASQSAYPVDLTGAVSMSAASSDGCQGAAFSIPISITVHK